MDKPPLSLLKKKKKPERKKIPDKMFAGNDAIPDRIVIYYNRKIDVKKIDLAIKHKYKKLSETIPFLVDEKRKKTSDIESLKSIIDKNKTKQEISQIEDKILDYTENFTLKKYVDQSRNLIIEITKNPEDQEKIEKFLSVCKKFITIDLIKNTDISIKCRGCGNILEEEETERENIRICPICNCYNPVMNPSKYTRDLEYNTCVYDEDISNFFKVLEKFEGKNNSGIHETLYDELDEYMKNINMHPGSFYRSLPLLKNGKKKGTSKKILWQALEFLSYNQYYEEASYICHVYWGWKLPDLSFYRDRLVEDYQKTQVAWAKIKKNYNRSASLGTQYRLYVQLMAVGYPYCEREDFRIQEMVESLRLHNHAWEEMCKETGIDFFPVSS